MRGTAAARSPRAASPACIRRRRLLDDSRRPFEFRAGGAPARPTPSLLLPCRGADGRRMRPAPSGPPCAPPRSATLRTPSNLSLRSGAPQLRSRPSAEGRLGVRIGDEPAPSAGAARDARVALARRGTAGSRSRSRTRQTGPANPWHSSREPGACPGGRAWERLRRRGRGISLAFESIRYRGPLSVEFVPTVDRAPPSSAPLKPERSLPPSTRNLSMRRWNSSEANSRAHPGLDSARD